MTNEEIAIEVTDLGTLNRGTPIEMQNLIKEALDQKDSEITKLKEEVESLKSALRQAGEACNYVYHAIRGSSEIVERNHFGELIPKNKNLAQAYSEVEKVLSSPLIKQLLEEK